MTNLTATFFFIFSLVFRGILFSQSFDEEISSLVKNPNLEKFQDVLRTSLETSGVRSISKILRKMGEQGSRLSDWHKLVADQAAGHKLIVPVSLEFHELRAANEVLARAGIDFLEFQRSTESIDLQTRTERRSQDEQAIAISTMKARWVGAGLGFATASFAGWLVLQQPGATEQFNQLVSLVAAGSFRRWLPFGTLGVLAFLYELSLSKIKGVWANKLWRPQDFWSRFLLQDALFPIFSMLIASGVAMAPPSVVYFPGPWYQRAFLGILLSTISINFLQAALQKGVRRGSISPGAATRFQSWISPFITASKVWSMTAVDPSLGMIAPAVTGGGLALPLWLKYSYLEDRYDKKTGHIWRGGIYKPSICSLALQKMKSLF